MLVNTFVVVGVDTVCGHAAGWLAEDSAVAIVGSSHWRLSAVVGGWFGREGRTDSGRRSFPGRLGRSTDNSSDTISDTA